MTEMAIEAKGLVKTYPKGVRALDGVSFDVAAGSVFGLVGPNGAGKSTTVKILTTLSRPDRGGRRWPASTCCAGPTRCAGRSAAWPRSRASTCTLQRAREPAACRAACTTWAAASSSLRVETMLERFGLVDAARRVTSTYSGGMQRKLDVAMGLVHSPEVLFLDEPTTGLDPEARADMWTEIERLAGEEGLTILLTTHYLEEADRLARRVAIVDQGRDRRGQGTPDELKSELHGDAVHIELDAAETNGRVAAALADLGDVRDVVVEHGRLLHARADNGARAVPVMLQALEARGLPVVSVTVARPSLDDVYLKYTGRRFEEADTAAEVTR